MASQSRAGKRKLEFFAQLDALEASDDDRKSTRMRAHEARLASPPSSPSQAAIDGYAVPRPPVTELSTIKAQPASRRASEASPDELRPEEAVQQKLFAGKTFYFFPPSDIDQNRRFRISKAVSNGARWMRKWDATTVTHVIVDHALTFQDLLKFLKADTIPRRTVVVSEDYPGKCIAACTLLDHSQKAFAVRGYDPPQTQAKTSETVTRDVSKAWPKVKRAEPGDGIQLPASSASESQSARTTDDRLAHDSSDDHNDDHNDDHKDDHNDDHNDYPVSTSYDLQRPLIVDDGDFRQAVEDARATRNLPLDDDDAHDSVYEVLGDSERQQSDVEEQQSNDAETLQSQQRPERRVPRHKSKMGEAAWQSTFTCVNAEEQRPKKDANATTIALLQEMAAWYEKTRDEWRVRAYRKAIGTLKRHPYHVTTKEQANKLPFIGKRIAAKIEEIVWTGHLQRLDNARLEPTDTALQLFMGIYGVGFSQASKWVNEGFRTIEDLFKNNVRLSTNQQLGIDHYDDFQQRIPRAQVTAISNIVRTHLRSLDKAYDMVVGGSYRRGAADSGDVDVLLTKTSEDMPKMRQFLLEKLIPLLFEVGFLTAALAVPTLREGSKWLGACQLPSSADGSRQPWRRIDFLLVPSDEMGAAMLYWTGNDIFNRSMRLLARRKGLRLNQRGLFKDVLRRGQERLTDGELLEGRDERRIFELLKVPWQEPAQRNRY